MLIQNDFIPLHVLHPQEEIPQEWLNNNQSIIFQQGLQVYNLLQNPLYSMIVPSEKTENLLNLYYQNQIYKNDEAVMLRNSIKDFTFKSEDFAYVMRYLQWIYDEYKSEGALILLVHMERKEWMPFFVVQGCNSGAAVTYIMPVNSDEGLLEHVNKHERASNLHEQVVSRYNELYLDGWRVYGTIHSHCNFSAYHSGVDDNDEASFDGLHITIGNVRSNWSFSSRFMIRGYEIKLNLEDYLSDDIDNIKELVDNIELDEFHKSLMITNLIPRPELKKKATNLLTMAFRDDNNADSLWAEYLKEKGDDFDDYTNIGNLLEDFDEEFSENVLDLDEVVFLRNENTGKEIAVKQEYYYEHLDEYFTNYKIYQPRFVEWE